VIGNFSSASAWHQSTVMGVSHQTVRWIERENCHENVSSNKSKQLIIESLY
jgi:hypothetical protein